MAEFKSPEWKRAWGLRPAWSPRELASIMCGCDPRTSCPAAPVIEQEILLSIRVRELPIIEDLRWPIEPPERIYGMTALLKPRQAYAWGKQRQPETIIPFDAEDFGAGPDNLFERLPEPTQKAIEMVLNAPAGTLQKEIAANIQGLGFGEREATALASVCRPVESASRDRRSRLKKSSLDSRES